MQRLSFIILIVFITIVVSACQQRLTPDEVTTLYWQAIKSNDQQTLQEVTLNYDKVASQQVTKRLSLREFSIIRTMIEKQRSVVETELVFDTPSVRTITVETVLIKQGDHWLVDQQLTLAKLQGRNEIGTAIAAFRKFTQSFSKELDQSLNELERQAPVIRHELEGIVKKFSDRLPVLQKELDGFAKGLDQALKPLAKPATPPTTPEPLSKPSSATDT